MILLARVIGAVTAVEVGLLLARLVAPNLFGQALGWVGYVVGGIAGWVVIPALAMLAVLNATRWHRAWSASRWFALVAALATTWDLAALGHRPEILHPVMGAAAGSVVLLVNWIDTDPARLRG